ncbi:probable disease resistance protein At1g12290 [Gossypium hirsutum]|uniref:Probable disease resistance protein At1g12290 n=1 Tax=Gossypium hirsutum TaxID=3635 RepID=A0ABM2ZM79_GOSHI|nr:probable disease resistance protein At1g12290 [Gossypium hirsutum]
MDCNATVDDDADQQLQQISMRAGPEAAYYVWEVVVPGIPGPPTSSGSKSPDTPRGEDMKEKGHFSDVAYKPPIPSADKRPSDPTVGLESYVNQSLDEKAGDIRSILYNRRFALLLDDIWEWFDLTRAGLPLPTQENGSKVIFTTRRLDVCCQMQPNMDNISEWNVYHQEKLSTVRGEGWIRNPSMHPDICKLAEAVVEECAGLPLALITIGRAMASKKTRREWEYATEVLRQSAASVLPGVGKEMYPKLKFSYDSLTSERVKYCFLYCSLYPEDYLIEKDELVDCWIGEGLLDEHTNLSNARNQGHFIIGSLIDACLLEKEDNHFVKMHDVIRDTALWIAGESENGRFFVKSGAQLKEQPKAKKWEENENLEELPVGIASGFTRNLTCHSQNKKVAGRIEGPEKLKYLNLECTVDLEMIPQQLISSISKSASELEKASRFNKFFSCAIEHVGLLDFRDSRSLNIMALAKLQHLSLTGCNHLRDVSWVTFAPHLEELWIYGCNGLEEIISEEKLGEVAELKGNLNLFSKLDYLLLDGLPKLKTIYHHALPFPQLKKVHITGCPMLKKLPLNSNSAKGQRLIIEGQERWWKGVEWEDEFTRIAFLPTFKPLISEEMLDTN